MKSILLNRVLSALGLVVAFNVVALAQPTNGGPGPGLAPAAIPIDGGVSLLLAGGVAYGIKHLHARRKKA